MTGLLENIYRLQNENTLTFLYRVSKIVLGALNYTAVRKKYMDVFGLDMEEAEEMAGLTRGYPFAFQVPGYLFWENRDSSLKDILPEYDQYLDEYVYGKIWSELSGQDRKVLAEMAGSGETKVKNIRERTGMSSGFFGVPGAPEEKRSPGYRQVRRDSLYTAKVCGICFDADDLILHYTDICSYGKITLFKACSGRMAICHERCFAHGKMTILIHRRNGRGVYGGFHGQSQ